MFARFKKNKAFRIKSNRVDRFKKNKAFGIKSHRVDRFKKNKAFGIMYRGVEKGWIGQITTAKKIQGV